MLPASQLRLTHSLDFKHNAKLLLLIPRMKQNMNTTRIFPLFDHFEKACLNNGSCQIVLFCIYAVETFLVEAIKSFVVLTA